MKKERLIIVGLYFLLVVIIIAGCIGKYFFYRWLFWASLDGKLVMMMKNKEGKYYVCGGWECPIRENDFEVIQEVPLPKNYSPDQLYYL